MNILLVGLLSLVTLAWGWDQLSTGSGATAFNPWIVRQEALYLTGLWSFSLLSLAMVLSSRPAWLERPLGGMDRIYRTHKWAGILAVGFAAVHWLVEMSDDIIKSVYGRTGRPAEEHAGNFLESMRDLGENLGEWAIYALLAMLVLTLWKRFPFNIWRYLHKAMPVLYLMLAIHAAFLAPFDFWTQPIGALLAMLLAAGSVSSVQSLFGWIGRRRQVSGIIEAVRESAPGITEVVCRLDEGWQGHRAGQFAFVTFDRLEGDHPFTIACADRGDRRITLQIKALGDYTRTLAHRLQPGQQVRVEGPYGRFDFRRGTRKSNQIWIAGGIGVTPFLAWLESLQDAPAKAPTVDLYYCTRRRENDPFVARLETLCATLPTIRLHVHGGDGDALTAEALYERHGNNTRPEIWFCGPRGLADTLRSGLRELGMNWARFHQEAFEMR
ncbi:MAG TPA: ferric reductase-like transmembrane domain-containing protein [Burkholderiales bacterium]